MPSNFQKLFTRLKLTATRLANQHKIVAKSKPEMNTPALDEAIDLTPQPLKRQPNMAGGSTEGAALRALVAQMNTPQPMGPNDDPLKMSRKIDPAIQADVDATLRGGGGVPTLVQGVAATPRPAAQAAFEPTAADFSRVFFTGRLAAGKDHCADAAGYAKLGLADPIYEIVSRMTGVEITSTAGKDVPGIRALLQAVGQYGRGTVSAQYPWTLSRVMFLDYMKRLFPATMAEGFGQNDNFWVEKLLASVEPGARIAVTNVRFKNEFEQLRAQGFEHWHVMTSAAEWNARLTAKNLTPQSKELNDVSEEFAKGIDREIANKLKQPGGKIRCIWNSNTPVPSPRLYSVAEFVARVNAAPAASPAQADVFTGD